MKNQNNQTIRIINYFEFRETITSPEHYDRVMIGLKRTPEIHNSITVVNYSDEGFATFEVIQNLPNVLLLCFTGTAC